MDPYPLHSSLLPLLGRYFSDPAVPKILHDCRRDCRWLLDDFGIHLAGVWDTFQAEGRLQEMGKSEGRRGYKDLCERHLGVSVDKSEQVRRPKRTHETKEADKEQAYNLTP